MTARNMRGILLAFGICLSISAFPQSAGDFQTHQSGNWNQTSTWERFNGSSWVTPAPSTPTSADGVITIIDTHNITVTADVTVDQVAWDNSNPFSGVSGSITVASGVTLTVANGSGDDIRIINDFTDVGLLQIDGTLSLSNGATIVDDDYGNLGSGAGPVSSDTYKITSTGKHIHTTGTGVAPIPAADWQVGSTCQVNAAGSGVPTISSLIVFHHFIWNGTAQSAVANLTGQLLNVNGDLSITGTNGQILQMGINTSFTLAIGNDFNISGNSRVQLNTSGNPVTYNIGRDFNLSSTSAFANAISFGATGTTTINVSRNFSKSGTATCNALLSTGTTNFNLTGNFSVTAGTLTKSGAGAATVNFNGTSAQLYQNTGSITGSLNFAVANLSILDLQTSAVTGSGTFTLGPSSTLKVGSTDTNGAIQTITAGNIQVSGTRSYNSTSTIIYNGSALQKIGNGFPSNVNLEIANASGVTNNNVGVTNVVGNLTLTSGSFNIGASNTLNIQSNFIVTGGTIGGTSTSSLTFSGSGTVGTLTFTGGAQNIQDLTIGRSGTVNLGSDLTISGTLNLTSGNLNFTGHTLTMNGSSITSSGTGLRSTSSTNSNLVFGGSTFSGTIPFSGAGNAINNLTLSTNGGVYAWNSPVTIASSLTLDTNGALTHTSGITMGTGSTLFKGSGTWTGTSPGATTSYNVTYTAPAASTGLELPTSISTLGNLNIDPSSGSVVLSSAVNVNGNLLLSSGTLSTGSNNITMRGTGSNLYVNGGALSAGTATVNFTGTTTIGTTASGGVVAFNNISITNALTLPSLASNVLVSIGGNLTNNGTLNRGSSNTTFTGTTVISGSGVTGFTDVTVTGSLTAPSGTMSVAGDFTNNGTFNHNNGTVSFNGSSDILGSATSNFFTISLSGTLNAPTGTLGIAGNFSNSGTFNHNNGTVAFNGTVSSQSVTGSTLTFNNMTVSNAIGLAINNTSRLNGTFTLSGSGLFDADGSGSGIFIVSSTSQTVGGRIASLTTPANFTGNVTVERYIHGASGGDYRYIAVPITNADVSMLKASVFVTGSFSDRSTHADNSNIVDSGNTNPSVFSYNSTTQAYVAVSGATTASTALSNTVGYSAYDYNNGAVTASFRGTIGKGSVVATISSTNGNFNLVPNPYPSPIDWDNVTKTNVNNAMYLRVANNVFSSYVGGLASNAPFVGWSGEVATGQSFFTTSNGGGATLTFKEADKTGGSSYFLRTASPENYFRVQLSSTKGEQDEAIIHFVKGASDGIDSEFDATKIKNGIPQSPLGEAIAYPNISSYISSPSSDFSINTMDVLTGPKIVRLNVSDVRPGNYSIAFSDFSNMYLGYNVVLVDTFLKTEIEAKDNVSYDFAVTSDKSSFGSDRFYLRINGAGVITSIVAPNESRLAVYPNPVTDKLIIELSPEEDKNVKSIALVDVTGRVMVSSETNKQLLTPGQKTIDVSNYTPGVYVLSIQIGDFINATRVIKK